jgi:hypothetical protein
MFETSKPGSCRAAGLTCATCVSGSAQQLSVVCGDIPGPEIDRIFFAMYDDPACSGMSEEFAVVYLTAVREADAKRPLVQITTTEAKYPAASVGGSVRFAVA